MTSDRRKFPDPSDRRDFARAVLARENILEVRARVGRAGEAAPNADDCDLGGASPSHEPISSGSGDSLVHDRFLERSQLAGEDDLDVALRSIAKLIDQQRRSLVG